MYILPSALLFSLGLVSGVEREGVLTGAPDEAPAVVYAAADVPVALVFDAALQKGSAVVVPGADVHPHPFRPNALVLTPSSALAAHGSSPMSVPLVDGVVALTLSFTPDRCDRLVRFARRAPAARAAPTAGELQSALRIAAPAVLGDVSGADVKRGVVQRVMGGFSYLLVKNKKNLECVPTSARMARGEESVEVLLAEQAKPCVAGKVCYLILVVRAPAEEAADYVLELLAADGAVCELSSGITLGPQAP